MPGGDPFRVLALVQVLSWLAWLARGEGSVALADGKIRQDGPARLSDLAGAGNLIRAAQAACSYSWRRPSSRSFRRMTICSSAAGSVIGSGSRRSGLAFEMPRWGRCALKWRSYSRRACRRWAWFPDEGAVERLVAAGLDPPFHDRVHAGDLDAAEHDREAGVGEDGIEQGRVLAVAIAEKVLHAASCVLDPWRGCGRSG